MSAHRLGSCAVSFDLSALFAFAFEFAFELGLFFKPASLRQSLGVLALKSSEVGQSFFAFFGFAFELIALGAFFADPGRPLDRFVDDLPHASGLIVPSLGTEEFGVE